MDRRVLGVAAGFSVILALATIARPLLPIDETRYLAVAWEMHLSGDPVHLTRNFGIYTHKPPLLFWLINLVWSVTGVSEIAARLVGPAFGVVAVLATAAFALRIWPDDRDSGWRAALVLSTLPVFAVYADATMFDALLTCCVIWSQLVLWRIGQGEHRTGMGVLLGVGIGLGVLAKGPVVLVHLIPVVLTIRYWGASPPGWRRGLTLGALALGVGAAIVAVWIIPALATGTAEFRHEVLWSQSAGRVVGGLAHDRPFWFFAALVPVIAFPWGWALIGGLRRSAVPKGDRGLRFAFVWMTGGVVLFSLISGKQAHYLLPELPPLALIVARLWPFGRERSPWIGGMLLIAAAVLFAGALGWHIGPAALRDGPGLWLAAGLVAGAGVVVLAAPARRALPVAGLALFAAGNATVALTGLGRIYDEAPMAALVAVQSNGEGATVPLALFGMADNAQFNFALRRMKPVTVLSADDVAVWAKANPDGLVIGPVRQSQGWRGPEAKVNWAGTSLGLWAAPDLSAPAEAPLG